MSKRLVYFACMAVGVLVLGTVAQAVHDVTAPGDPIVGIPNDGVSQNDDHGWPGNEPPPQASRPPGGRRPPPSRERL